MPHKNGYKPIECDWLFQFFLSQGVPSAQGLARRLFLIVYQGLE